MDIVQIIGQLFILGFKGTSFSDTKTIRRDISRGNLGGVILFNRFLANGFLEKHNIVSLPQVKELIAALQKEAEQTLLVSIDQEGGKVCRLKEEHGFFSMSSPEELGKSGLEHSRCFAKRTAEALVDLGFNLNFAPVADLARNEDNPVIAKLGRSFSKEPQLVTDHCRIWLTEHRKQGIFGCLKHFPGHGSSTLDSHKYFVDVSETWSTEELLPFRNLIAEGLVHCIMTGHLFNKTLDPHYPATLSQNTLQHLLRDKLGYTGILITDDMQMQAIISQYGLAAACVLALAAGADLVIVGNNLQYQPNLLDHLRKQVLEALRDGTLSEEQLFAKYERITRMKNLLTETS